MADSKANRSETRYRRLQQRILRYAPAIVTPLRLNILIGYLLVAAGGLIAWEHIEYAWHYLAALFAPISALLGAMLALRIGVVVVTIFTLLTSIIKIFSGILMVVIKPGVIKAIFVPPILSLIKWIHSKSSRLQRWVDQFYDRLKRYLKVIIDWWGNQNTADKVLLSGFLIPVLIVVLVVFLVERATAVFAGKKLVEQIVQKTTKFVISQFHRIPVIGRLPELIKTQAQKFTLPQDRRDLARDLKNLGNEIYHKEPDKADTPDKQQANQ